jgi:hypothetical protein
LFFSPADRSSSNQLKRKNPDTQKNWAIINLSIAVGVFLSPEF